MLKSGFLYNYSKNKLFNNIFCGKTPKITMVLLCNAPFKLYLQ